MSVSAVSAFSTSHLLASLNTQSASSPAQTALSAGSGSGDAVIVDLSAFVTARANSDTTGANKAVIQLKADLTSESTPLLSSLNTSTDTTSGLGGLLSTLA